MDETDASLNCIYIQLLTSHPSEDSYMFWLFRLYEGRLCCMYSKSGVRAKPVSRWVTGSSKVKFEASLKDEACGETD